MNTTTDKHNVEVTRTIEQLVAGQATSDGAGVKLTRVLTQNLQHRLDPFLMLDATSQTTTLPASPITRTAVSKP